MTVTVATSASMTDYESTSTTSLAVSIASKSLTVQAGKKYTANDTVQLIATAGQRLETRLSGTVTSYNSGTGALVVNATGLMYPYAAAYASKLMATGAWTFVTDPGLNLAASDPIRIYRIGAVANYLVGTVTTYNNTTGDITVNITSIGGSGTYSDWAIISDGTFTSWTVAPQTGDTIDVTGTATFTIDATPICWPSVIRALTRGTITMRNASTSVPLVLTLYNFGQEAVRAEGNGTIDILGGWISMGSGNNTAGQTFTPPAAIDYPSLVEVETAAGSGIYRQLHMVSNGGLADWGHVYRYATTDFGSGNELEHVALFDPAGRTITSKGPLPTGANVRVPNIHITTWQHVTYLAAAIADGVATSAVVNWPNVHASSGEAQIESERISWSAKTNATLTIARAQRSTTGVAHAQGARVRTMMTQGTSGNGLVARLDLNPSGTASIVNCSFGYFYLRCENHKSATIDHVGVTGTVDVLNSPAGVSITSCQAGYTPWFGNVGKYALSALSGDVVLKWCYNFTDSSQTNQSNTATSITNCFSIAEMEDCESFIGKRNGSGTSNNCFQFSQSAMKTPGTAIKDLLAVGGRLAVSNCANLIFTNYRHGDQTNGTDSSTAAQNAVYLLNVTSVSFILPVKVGASCRNEWLYCDAPSNGVYCYSPVYDLNNNGNCALNNLGTATKVYNGTFGNARAVTDALSGNNVTGADLDLRNCRFTSPAGFLTGQGIPYMGKGMTCDGVTGLSMYWATGGQMVPNYGDCGPFFTLWDSDTATTGRICVGSFAGAIARDMYTLTGAYLDYGGRIYMEAAGDVAIIKSCEAIKSVTSFQSVVPAFELAPGNFTVGNAGSTYVSGTEYACTGGSGTGAKIRAAATTITTAAVMTAGIGYAVGDVLTVTGGSGTGQITLTWVPTFEFRVANPGGIAGASWQSMTAANLAGCIASLSGYSSNVGFDMQVRLTQQGTVTGAYIVNLRLLTNNDGSYQYLESWFTVNGVDSTDTIELRKASDNSLITTWTGGGQSRFLGASVFAQAAYFVRKTSGGTTLRSTIATPVTLAMADNGAVALDAAQIQISGLSGHAVYLEDDAGTQIDYQASVTGTYRYQIPAGFTGTWKWAAKRVGYKHATGSFTPTMGVTANLSPSMPQKLLADGSPMYQGTTSALVTVVISGTSFIYLDIGNGVAPIQAAFDEAEDALVTAAGLRWLAAGRDDIAIFPTSSISYLFLTNLWRLRRESAGYASAAIEAYASSTDGTPQDIVNGTVFYYTSSAASDIARAVWDKILETGFSASRLLRTTAASTSGKTTEGPTSFTARNLADTQDQVMGTVNPATGRTEVTYGA